MKKRAIWLLLAWFAVALTGCETIKGLGRDILNLGDVLTGKRPSHRTFRSEEPKGARQGTPEPGEVVGHLQKTR